MDVILNNEIPRLYDFVFALDILYNKSSGYPYDLNKFNLKEDSRITDAKTLIWKNIDESTPGLALFIKHKKTHLNFFTHRIMSRYIQVGSIDNLIKEFCGAESTLLKRELISFYDDKTKESIFYEELLNNNNELYSYINNLKINTLQKWELTVFLNKPTEILEPFEKLCRIIEKRINQVYKKNTALISSFEKRLKVKIEKNPQHLIDTELKIFSEKVSPYAAYNFVLSYSLLKEFFGMSVGGMDYTIIFLGIHYDRSLRWISVADDILEDEVFFKALGDKTRLKIIKLLLQRKMYVGEIAKECNLKISTISYHLEILSLGGIVGHETAKNHVYYMLSETNIKTRLEKILKVFKN